MSIKNLGLRGSDLSGWSIKLKVEPTEPGEGRLLGRGHRERRKQNKRDKDKNPRVKWKQKQSNMLEGTLNLKTPLYPIRAMCVCGHSLSFRFFFHKRLPQIIVRKIHTDESTKIQYVACSKSSTCVS